MARLRGGGRLGARALGQKAETENPEKEGCLSGVVRAKPPLGGLVGSLGRAEEEGQTGN